MGTNGNGKDRAPELGLSDAAPVTPRVPRRTEPPPEPDWRFAEVNPDLQGVRILHHGLLEIDGMVSNTAREIAAHVRRSATDAKNTRRALEEILENQGSIAADIARIAGRVDIAQRDTDAALTLAKDANTHLHGSMRQRAESYDNLALEAIAAQQIVSQKKQIDELEAAAQARRERHASELVTTSERGARTRTRLILLGILATIVSAAVTYFQTAG